MASSGRTLSNAAAMLGLALSTGGNAMFLQTRRMPRSRQIWLSRQRHERRSSGLGARFRNHLEEVATLENDFFALRHGQSMANVAKIIASSPEIACQKYGLSETGRAQAEAAGHIVAETFSSGNKKYDGVRLISSDLLRAKETAETVADVLQECSISTSPIVFDTRLRERGFGEWDGGSDEHYADVWKDDKQDPFHEIRGVESVASVMDRASCCVTEWDSKLENQLIVLVAHGDVLQILQAAFSKIDGSEHRSLEHLETATLRKLVLAP